MIPCIFSLFSLQVLPFRVRRVRLNVTWRFGIKVFLSMVVEVGWHFFRFYTQICRYNVRDKQFLKTNSFSKAQQSSNPQPFLRSSGSLFGASSGGSLGSLCIIQCFFQYICIHNIIYIIIYIYIRTHTYIHVYICIYITI